MTELHLVQRASFDASPNSLRQSLLVTIPADHHLYKKAFKLLQKGKTHNASF